MAGLHPHTVLVTGANRGIGLGLVQKLLELPSPPQWVFAGCRDPNGQRARELQSLASKHPNLVIIALEVSDPTSIKAAAARVGEKLGGLGLNLLINNAAIAKPILIGAETLESMTEVYTTNTIGPLLLGQAFLPLLKKAAQGSPGSALSCSKAAIINISSNGGSITSPAGWELSHYLSYRCSKAALNMLTKCQSLVYGEHGVLCVALHPGWVQTDMGGEAGHMPRAQAASPLCPAAPLDGGRQRARDAEGALLPLREGHGHLPGLGREGRALVTLWDRILAAGPGAALTGPSLNKALPKSLLFLLLLPNVLMPTAAHLPGISHWGPHE
ncbi:uncharacterized protein [Heliangelus exortis]|uniref:uncharacterized protein isoform X1 n=1 Tax=Heliangelus exortis TaxID=472823 RepID=UPI003A921A02